MAEILLRFENEDREGVVPVGTYLIDAARRFGIRIDDDPISNDGQHACAVAISSGAELLSEPTKLEREYFKGHGRNGSERLACQTKIEKAGEVIIMTDKKKSAETESESEKDANERYRKEFEEMSLETKIANLVKLEAIALGETLSFVANTPFKIVDKVMDVMAEFGLKKEDDAKNAQRPAEHKQNSATNGSASKTKGASKKAGNKHKPI